MNFCQDKCVMSKLHCALVYETRLRRSNMTPQICPDTYDIWTAHVGGDTVKTGTIRKSGMRHWSETPPPHLDKPACSRPNLPITNAVSSVMSMLGREQAGLETVRKWFCFKDTLKQGGGKNRRTSHSPYRENSPLPPPSPYFNLLFLS